MPTPIFLAALLGCIALSACDSSPTPCGPAPSTAASGSFQLQFEEAGGCFELLGTSARFGTNTPQYSDSSTVYVQLFPDDRDEPTDVTTFVELLTQGSRPLSVGQYDVADLYVRSSAPYAPPSTDARLLEYPGEVAIAVVIRRNEILLSRGGTLTVTQSGPEGFAGRIDAELATQQTANGQDSPGTTLRVRGAFDSEPGAEGFIIVL